METKNKIIIGALIGAGILAGTAFAAYKLIKTRKVCLIEGNDEDVVYFLLDDD